MKAISEEAPTMPNQNDQHRGLIIGPIDTESEIKIILDKLATERYLVRMLSPSEVQKFINELIQNRILRGPIDTLFEIQIFLDMLRKSDLLVVGAIDTPEEIKAFLDTLRDSGVLQNSISNSRLSMLKQNEDMQKNKPNP